MSPPVDLAGPADVRSSGSVSDSDLIIEALSVAEDVTDELVASIGRILPQLSRSAPAPSRDELVEIVTSPATTMFVARLDASTVGALTLAVFRIPTGLRAWIEDVVVDDAARGRGIGELLNRAAIDHAASLGARTVDLTSRPSREAANRLYQGSASSGGRPTSTATRPEDCQVGTPSRSARWSSSASSVSRHPARSRASSSAIGYVGQEVQRLAHLVERVGGRPRESV